MKSINGTIIQFFHWYMPDTGDLWRKVGQQAKWLSEHGITALWLPPPFKGAKGADDIGYSVYDLYDLGEFNQKGSIRTKYGTKDEFLTAIRKAHENNMQVYADVIFNHKSGADETEWLKASRIYKSGGKYNYGEELWIEAWTKFNFQGRDKKYSDFIWNYHHFDGTNYAQNLGESAIFKIIDKGKDWEKMIYDEEGSYDYLISGDVDMNHPEVRTELFKWGKWFIDFTGIDGFRFANASNIQYSFIRDWIDHMRKTTGKDLFALGEFWNQEVDKQLFFNYKTRGKMSLTDAALQYNLFMASRTPNGQYDMRKIFDNTLLHRFPLLSVTLVGNHLTQPCRPLESEVDFWFKPLAYAILLLRSEGYPCVFYPDLYGAEYSAKGHDGKAYDIDLKPVPKLPELLKVRSLYAYGMQRDYFNHENIIGWTREGDKYQPNSGVAVLISNGDEGEKWMQVGNIHAGKKFYDYLGNRSEVIEINQNGWGKFLVNGGSVSAWVQK